MLRFIIHLAHFLPPLVSSSLLSASALCIKASGHTEQSEPHRLVTCPSTPSLENHIPPDGLGAAAAYNAIAIRDHDT